jgi:hypothetical protein
MPAATHDSVVVQISAISSRGEGPASAPTVPMRMPLPKGDSDSDSGSDTAAAATGKVDQAKRTSKLKTLLSNVERFLIRSTDRVFFPSRT